MVDLYLELTRGNVQTGDIIISHIFWELLWGKEINYAKMRFCVLNHSNQGRLNAVTQIKGCFNNNSFSSRVCSSCICKQDCCTFFYLIYFPHIVFFCICKRELQDTFTHETSINIKLRIVSDEQRKVPPSGK